MIDSKASDWDRLREALERFERAWQQEHAPEADLNAFLPPPQDALRTVALHELIKADLENRWRRGRQINLEQYCQRFPELGSARTLPAPLIYEEYLVRQRYGDQLPLGAYQARFPDQFPELQRIVLAEPTPTPGPVVTFPSTQAPIQPAGKGDTPTKPLTTVPPAAPASPPGAAILESREILRVGGGYKLLKRIGRGGFGEVWRAEAPGGVEVAIKIIFGSVTQQEAAQRELQALELMRRLRYAYLLSMHAYWQMEDRLVIAMELADGSLRDWARKRQQVGEKDAATEELVRYFCEAAEAIDYLHSKHVIHRDIKPENILLLEGHAKVADFGLARVLEQSRGLMTVSGCGTPAYMAPEIIGRGKIGEQSDQYSLAAAYAELRLNRPLFPGRCVFEMLQDHMTRTPDLAPLPQAEQDVLQRALAKDPSQRYPSCREFTQALAKVLTPHLQLPAVAPKRRLLVLSVVLFALLAVAGLLTGYWFWRGSFTLGAPAPVALAAAETSTLTVQVQRMPFHHEPITLTFPDKPANVTITEATVAEDRDSAQVEIVAAPDAGIGTSHVTIHAEAGASVQDTVFELTVQPLAYALPPGWKKANEAKLVKVGGKRYYDRIDVVKDDLPVRFVLITKDRSRRSDPDTFYMMENKVWVNLYRPFDSQRTNRPKNQEWSKLPVNGNDRHPVFGVPWPDARDCALWLGGVLPTRDQWDKAAGCYLSPEKRGRGPFQEPQNQKDPLLIGIRRTEPTTIDEPTQDISPFDIHGMAGNGLEWTRDPAGLDRKWIWLRGRSYKADRPLCYQDLEAADTQQLGIWRPAEGADDIGFRVVIEP